MEKISVLICTGISTKTTGKCMCIYPLFTYLLMVWPSHYLAGYQIPPQNGWEVVFLIQAHSSLLGDVEQSHEMLESIAQFEHALLNASAAWYVGDGSHGAREGMTRMGSILLRFLQPSYLQLHRRPDSSLLPSGQSSTSTNFKGINSNPSQLCHTYPQHQSSPQAK